MKKVWVIMSEYYDYDFEVYREKILAICDNKDAAIKGRNEYLMDNYDVWIEEREINDFEGATEKIYYLYEISMIVVNNVLENPWFTFQRYMKNKKEDFLTEISEENGKKKISLYITLEENRENGKPTKTEIKMIQEKINKLSNGRFELKNKSVNVDFNLENIEYINSIVTYEIEGSDE